MFGNYPNNETPREHLLFVYGTLMTGQRNHRWMEEFIEKGYAELFSKDAVVRNHAIVDIGGLPALYSVTPRMAGKILGTDKPVSIRTNGELYSISIQAIDALDMFEGHPHFYNRQFIEVRIPPDRKTRNAMVYRGPQPRRGTGVPNGVLIGNLLHNPNRYGLVSEFGIPSDRIEMRMTDGGNFFFPAVENRA